MTSSIHLISVLLTLVVVTALGVYTIRKIKSSADFSVGGRKMGPLLIAGTLVGSFIGGGSTIGTAELAYQVGFSAWWFTLGGGIAILILGLFLAGPLRESGLTTAPQYLAKSFGQEIRPFASLFSSIGVFLSLIVQNLSAIALFSSMFKLPPIIGAIITLAAVLCYILFGGVWGTSIVGTIKSVLVYVTFAVAGIMAYILLGGHSGLFSFPSYPWLSMFGQGYSTDLAAGFSVIVGVLSTQIFLQAIFSARDVRAARWGSVISACLIIPTGLGGTLVGLFMRSHYPAIVARDALPLFILNYMNPWLGGLVWAGLLISVVGTAAGLTLGMCTTLGQDIYKKVFRPQATDAQVLKVTRSLIVLSTLFTLVFVSGKLNTMILQWSYLSMGLRGATICFPLLAAIFFKGRIYPAAGRWAVIMGPLAVLIWSIFGPASVDPLYIGMSLSLVILVIGAFIGNKLEERAMND